MRFNSGVCVVVLLVCFIARTQAQDDVVNTKYGPVRGLVLDGYRRFQGVPFASPPLGPLRWKNAVAPQPWGPEPLDCRSFDIGCAQLGHSLEYTSEDCLYLELWTPPKGKYHEPAAVSLFFYGGDFKEGGESFKLYDGAWMASTGNNILVVTNYRIGVLGFLYNPPTLDANVGIGDQRFTLKWIQDNIAAFGGDPNKVTIFGQSAGGQSVLIHYTSPDDPAAQWFHGAICESGPPLSFRDESGGSDMEAAFALQLGCPIQDAKCMQAANTSAVLQAARHSLEVPLTPGQAFQKWAPVQPLYAFEKGEIVKVPLMIGSNLHDGLLFGQSMSATNMSSLEYDGIVLLIFGLENSIELLKMYPAAPPGHDNRPILSRLITDWLFLCPSRYVIRLAEKAGVNSTYLYQYAFPTTSFCPWPQKQSYCCGQVCHGSEIPYWSHDTGPPFPWNMTDTELKMASAMSDYWTSFFTTSNPNTPGVPTWPLYRTSSDVSQKLAWPLSSVTGLERATCDVWDRIGYYEDLTPSATHLVHLLARTYGLFH